MNSWLVIEKEGLKTPNNLNHWKYIIEFKGFLVIYAKIY